MDATPEACAEVNFGNAEPLPHSPTVLLLVDFINPLQFDGAEQLAPAAVEAARRTAELKRRLRAQGVQAVYANDNYGIWRSEFRDLLRYCKEVGGAPAEMAALLAPGPEDTTILKPRHSAFFATPLELVLQQMHARELVIVGLATDICVHFTAMDGYLRGFRMRVPAACTAAETGDAKRVALEQMRDVLRVDTADDFEPARD